MQCPKCAFKQADNNTICDSCGIVFEKYYKYHPAKNASIIEPIENKADASPIRLLLLNTPQSFDSVSFNIRLVLLLFFIIWSIRLINSAVENDYLVYSFLNNVNLPFHEAGHIIFAPFGSFIASLGGTLGQILMPIICCLVLLIKTRDPFGASITFWWLGENFLDIAPYINDSRAGVLPLIGGNFGHSSPYGFHDWEYLLNETGLLQYDHSIAKLSFFTGCVIMLISLIWAAILLFKEYQLKS